MIRLAREVATKPGKPPTVGKELLGPDADKRQEAMDEELQGLLGKGSSKDVARIKTRFVLKIR